MDYEFTIDDYNKPVARFSIGHEALGRWLTEELCGNNIAIAELLDCVRQLEQHEILQHQVVGKEFQLRLNREYIEVIALALDFDVDEELPENTSLYDQESYAECGIQDFKQALLDWQTFVH